MANAVTTQTLEDGRRNLTILLTGTLDTSDEASNVKVDVSTFTGPNGEPALSRVSVKKLKWSVSSQLNVHLKWNATTDVAFAKLNGQGEMCFEPGIKNNAGTGVDGDIELVTTGWASGIQTYMIWLELMKVS